MEIRNIPYSSTWAIRHQVMWPDRTIEYVKLPHDKDGQHFGLFIEDEIVSIVSVFLVGKVAQFRKFATLKEEQGKGYGSRLLSYVIEKLISSNIEKVWCNARSNKAKYYERFGLQRTNQSFSKGGIDYVIMEMTTANKRESI